MSNVTVKYNTVTFLFYDCLARYACDVVHGDINQDLAPTSKCLANIAYNKQLRENIVKICMKYTIKTPEHCKVPRRD